MLLTGNAWRAGRWLLLVPAGMAVALFYLLDPEESLWFPRCPFFVITGWYCPGCGSQRAIHSLLHLNFREVAEYNFLIFPAAVLILYHYTHEVLNRRRGWKLPDILYWKNTPLVILVVVILFWIVRNIPAVPFCWLSPG